MSAVRIRPPRSCHIRCQAMKIAERGLAITLRRDGWTYSAIQRRLCVSKGSLSRWLRGVPYTPSDQTLARRKLASVAAGQVLHQRKLDRVERIYEEARQNLPDINRDTLHWLGIVAYWAEGSKTQDGLVAFTNTDPLLIQLIREWLIECCGADPGRFRLHIRVHRDIARADAETYWRAVTGIPPEQCERTTIKESGSGGRKARKLRHGIATIKVCDTNLHYRIQGWIRGLCDRLSSNSAPVAQLERAADF